MQISFREAGLRLQGTNQDYRCRYSVGAGLDMQITNQEAGIFRGLA